MGEASFEGLDARALAVRLGLPACEIHDLVGSTMDLAHAAAGRGTTAGTLILANEQEAGRGRGGRRWSSAPGGGLWMTLVERPASPSGFDVLSLRVGLFMAEALDALAGERVRLKWPNDLYVGEGKLAGILIEARWRDQRVEWVAIGVGVNIVPAADVPGAAGLAAGVSRLQALDAVLPELRAAAAVEGPLTVSELSRYAARDLSVGRWAVQPAVGVVAGISRTGELMVDTSSGPVACRAGSLVFAEDR
ncbi:MAG: biotin--[acetyl-CoA-carboxylase] ligase [Gemmatimonadetes bacterium]|nr:biotin--[acetyl-CoA-carboxylase] ligase [Gemmatimonadota bacterium]